MGMIVLVDGIEGARSIAMMDDRQEALLNRFYPALYVLCAHTSIPCCRCRTRSP